MFRTCTAWLAAAVAVPLALTLAACAPTAGPTPSTSETPAPAPTVTVTATATVTPAPVSPEPVAQAPGDAVTGLEAFAMCVVVSQVNDVQAQYWAPLPYSADVVTDQGDGSFRVTPGFSPLAGQEGGAQTTCIVGGTIGAPTMEYQGAVDFG